MNKTKKFFLGLIIQPNYIGYAVTDIYFNLIKFKGEPMWGVLTCEEDVVIPATKTFDIIDDVVKVMGKKPDKIFTQDLPSEDVIDTLKTIYGESKIITVAPDTVNTLRENVDLGTPSTINISHIAKEAYLTIIAGQSNLHAIQNNVINKNAVHITRYTFCDNNADNVAFYRIVKYNLKNGHEVVFLPIEAEFAERFEKDEKYARNYALEKGHLWFGEKPSDIQFPLGERRLKIGTMLEIDGKLVTCINSTKRGDTCIKLRSITPLIIGREWERFVGKLERFSRVTVEPHTNYYNEITTENNLRLFDILTQKLSCPTYKPLKIITDDIIEKARDVFAELDLLSQVKALIDALGVFKCDNNGLIKPYLNCRFSCWKHFYKEVRIIDSTASGLFETKTENLLNI